jgi:3-dehydroquinate dehydratase-2
MKILVLNGPNLNLLGMREPDKYGTQNYAALVEKIEAYAALRGVDVKVEQSNHEGVLIDYIQAAYGVYDGIVINPAAYTHTSIAILDAILAVRIPTVEVHISDVSKREAFRQVSYVREAAIATVMGEGLDGYLHAMDILFSHLEQQK